MVPELDYESELARHKFPVPQSPGYDFSSYNAITEAPPIYVVPLNGRAVAVTTRR